MSRPPKSAAATSRPSRAASTRGRKKRKDRKPELEAVWIHRDAKLDTLAEGGPTSRAENVEEIWRYLDTASVASRSAGQKKKKKKGEPLEWELVPDRGELDTSDLLDAVVYVMELAFTATQPGVARLFNFERDFLDGLVQAARNGRSKYMQEQARVADLLRWEAMLRDLTDIYQRTLDASPRRSTLEARAEKRQVDVLTAEEKKLKAQQDAEIKAFLERHGLRADARAIRTCSRLGPYINKGHPLKTAADALDALEVVSSAGLMHKERGALSPLHIHRTKRVQFPLDVDDERRRTIAQDFAAFAEAVYDKAVLCRRPGPKPRGRGGAVVFGYHKTCRPQR